MILIGSPADFFDSLSAAPFQIRRRRSCRSVCRCSRRLILRFVDLRCRIRVLGRLDIISRGSSFFLLEAV
jgi:hypothetical protein